MRRRRNRLSISLRTRASQKRVDSTPAATVPGNLLPNSVAYNEGSQAWTTGTNTNLFVVSDSTKQGSQALKLAPVGAGTVSASTNAAWAVVTAGVSYTASAWFKAESTARTCTVEIQWRDGSGGLLDSTASTGAADNSSTWMQRTVTAQAPVGAVRGTVRVVVASVVGDAHRVDEVSIVAA